MKLCLVLILLLLSGTARAESRCRALFASLKQGTVRYASEVKATKGLRVLLRAPESYDALSEKRLLLFWAALPDGKLPLRERTWRRFRTILGAELPAPAPGVRREFQFAGTIDYLIQRPFALAQGPLVRRGWLDSPRYFTIPSMIALTYPVWTGLQGVVDTLKEHNEAKHRESLLRHDFRFHELAEALQTEEEAYATLATSTNPEERAAYQKKHADFRERTLQTVGLVETQIRNYEALSAKYDERYRKAEGPEAAAALDEERTRELARSPLFADLPKLLGLHPDLRGATPAQLELLERLVTAREFLFSRYRNIPLAIRGLPRLGRNELPNVFLKRELDAIQSSEVYRELLPLYRAGQLPYGNFQRALMEDAFWELGRFTSWKLLGRQPPHRFENDEDTGQPLSITDVRREIINDAKKKIPEADPDAPGNFGLTGP